MSQSAIEMKGSQTFNDTVTNAPDNAEVYVKRESNSSKESSCGNNHKSHWMFSREETLQESVKEVKPISMKSLDSAFKRYIQQIRDDCAVLPTNVLSKQVSVEKSILVPDDIKYIFQNGSVKYPRNMSNECFPFKGEKRTSSIASAFKRQQPLRSAKSKAISYSDILAFSDDDDFIEETSKPSRKQTKLIHPSHKLLLSAIQDDDKIRKDAQKRSLENLSFPISDDEEKIAGSQTKKQKIEQDDEKPCTTFSGMKKAFEKGVKVIAGALGSTRKKDDVACEGGNQENPIQLDVLDETLPPALKRNVKTTTTTTKPVEQERLACPMCEKVFPRDEVNDHAFLCQGLSSPKATRSQSKSNKLKEKESVFDESAWKKASSGMEKTPTSENSSLEMSSSENSRKYTATLKKAEVMKTKPDISSNETTAKQNFMEVRETSNKKKIKRSTSVSTNKGYTTSNSITLANNKNNKGRALNNEDDKEIFGGYLPSSHQNKPRVVYSKRNFAPSSSKSNFFNNSMDNCLFKCTKCEKEFPEEEYNAHTMQCLDDTNMTFSQ